MSAAPAASFIAQAADGAAPVGLALPPELFGLILTFLWGACVGSFLNVVIYRVPAGLSVVSPPSTCPSCGQRLAWYDNVPVLGWLRLRGRCRTCRVPISRQYPMVEAATAVLFALVFWALQMSGHVGGLGAEPAAWWHLNAMPSAFTLLGIANTWPVLGVVLILVAVLVASTKIDAALYIIPLPLPWTALVIALLTLPVAAALNPATLGAMPVVSAPLVAAGLAGAAGWAVSMALLRLGVMRQSFSDEAEVMARLAAEAAEEPVAEPAPEEAVLEVLEDASASGFSPARFAVWLFGLGAAAVLPFLLGWFGGAIALVLFFWLMLLSRVDPQALGVAQGRGLEAERGDADVSPAAADAAGPASWLAYPHARREMLPELAFLAPPVVFAVLAANLAGGLALLDHPAVQALGSVLWGALVGAGVVWGIRIFGTLLFGKEAMGLGDVHLMAGVGAVIGAVDVTLAFFIAPFVGLLFVAVSAGARSLFRGGHTAVPYGPALCVGTLLALLLGGRILDLIFGGAGMVPLGPWHTSGVVLLGR